MMHDIKVINKKVITWDNVEHNHVIISVRQVKKMYVMQNSHTCKLNLTVTHSNISNNIEDKNTSRMMYDKGGPRLPSSATNKAAGLCAPAATAIRRVQSFGRVCIQAGFTTNGTNVFSR